MQHRTILMILKGDFIVNFFGYNIKNNFELLNPEHNIYY